MITISPIYLFIWKKMYFCGSPCGLQEYFRIPQRYPIDPSFCRKKLVLSLSHLVPEILGPKVGLFFHQNVLFNRFKAFCINVLLDFSIQLTPFSLISMFLIPHFHQIFRLDSDWVQFLLRAIPGYQKFGEVHPPPPPRGAFIQYAWKMYNCYVCTTVKNIKCVNIWCKYITYHG